MTSQRASRVVLIKVQLGADLSSWAALVAGVDHVTVGAVGANVRTQQVDAHHLEARVERLAVYGLAGDAHTRGTQAIPGKARATSVAGTGLARVAATTKLTALIETSIVEDIAGAIVTLVKTTTTGHTLGGARHTSTRHIGTLKVIGTVNTSTLREGTAARLVVVLQQMARGQARTVGRRTLGRAWRRDQLLRSSGGGVLLAQSFRHVLGIRVHGGFR